MINPLIAWGTMFQRRSEDFLLSDGCFVCFCSCYQGSSVWFRLWEWRKFE